MNAKKLAIASGSFTAILEKLEVKYVEQSGFYRVDSPNSSGARMYVGKGKVCTTVHLSGWTHDSGTRTLEKSPSTKVTQEMDWPEGLDAIEQLRLFARLVEALLALSAPASSPAPKKGKGPAVAPLLVDPSLVLDVAPDAPIFAQADQES